MCALQLVCVVLQWSCASNDAIMWANAISKRNSLFRIVTMSSSIPLDFLSLPWWLYISINSKISFYRNKLIIIFHQCEGKFRLFESVVKSIHWMSNSDFVMLDCLISQKPLTICSNFVFIRKTMYVQAVRRLRLVNCLVFICQWNYICTNCFRNKYIQLLTKDTKAHRKIWKNRVSCCAWIIFSSCE